jgi:hypothetical protein
LGAVARGSFGGHVTQMTIFDYFWHGVAKRTKSFRFSVARQNHVRYFWDYLSVILSEFFASSHQKCSHMPNARWPVTRPRAQDILVEALHALLTSSIRHLTHIIASILRFMLTVVSPTGHHDHAHNVSCKALIGFKA